MVTVDEALKQYELAQAQLEDKLNKITTQIRAIQQQQGAVAQQLLKVMGAIEALKSLDSKNNEAEKEGG